MSGAGKSSITARCRCATVGRGIHQAAEGRGLLDEFIMERRVHPDLVRD